MSLGWLTTISPSRMSTLLLGIPPPIPTIRPKQIEWKLESNYIATVIADIVPYAPSGRQAMTMLCAPILPRI